MSATTSPRATILPKFRSRRSRRCSEPYLAQRPYLLVRVAGLPQGRDDVALEVGDVAGDQGRLPLWDDPHLVYGGRQDARLGAPELLASPLVLDPHGVPDARERQATLGVGRLRIGLPQGPAFEGEVRASAAQDSASFAALEDEAGV